MATVVFAVPFAGTPGTPANPGVAGRVQMVISPTSASKGAVTISVTSPVTDHPTEAASYSQITRPGLTPWNFWTGPQLRTAAFTCVLWGYGKSMEATIASLRALVNVEVTVSNYGPLMAGSWWMSTVDISPQRRVPGTNETMQANLQITFTQASDPTTTASTPTTVAKNP
jgi:hypothetical protein